MSAVKSARKMSIKQLREGTKEVENAAATTVTDSSGVAHSLKVVRLTLERITAVKAWIQVIGMSVRVLVVAPHYVTMRPEPSTRGVMLCAQGTITRLSSDDMVVDDGTGEVTVLLHSIHVPRMKLCEGRGDANHVITASTTTA